MIQKLDNVLKQNVNLTNQTNSWTSLAYCSSINGTQSKHDCCNNINHQRLTDQISWSFLAFSKVAQNTAHF